MVTEFFDGAAEIGDADIDDQVIGQGLQLIRALWDAGIAHRDIKPGNLMVRVGELLLIDVAFAQVAPRPGGRPSTWATSCWSWRSAPTPGGCTGRR